MIQNYLKIAYRFLFKNKVYSFINILGLSVGMSCFILLTLFVQEEYSYDEYHQDKDRIYQVYLDNTKSTIREFSPATMAPMGPLMGEAVPGVEAFARFGQMGDKFIKLQNGNRHKISAIYYTDQAALDLFTLETIAGNPEPLLSPDNLTISKSEAIRLFGSVQAAIAQEIDIVDFGKLVVASVFEDLPSNTHVKFDYLMAFENADKDMKEMFKYSASKTVMNWKSVSAFPLYLKLKSSENLEETIANIASALSPHRPNDLVKLVPLTDIYFSELSNGYFGKKGEESNTQMYMVIAFVILAIAIINYMNMATARQSKRAKEVGIRKTVGGHRIQIAKQFFVESLVVTSVSLLIAICLSEMALPTLNAFIGKDLAIAYESVGTYLILTGFIIGIGFLAGVYPAMYLSKFNPIQILSGKITRGKGGGLFRKVLVGFQFFICLGLMAVTTIVYTQFNYMQNIDLGIEEDQVVGIPLKDANFQENYQVFKDEILKSPSINSASGVTYSVFQGVASFFVEVEGFEDDQMVTYMSVEPSFIETMGIDIESGLSFNQMDQSAKAKAQIVNQTAVEQFGWNDPLDQKLMGRSVSGVAKDFIYGSAKDAIAPLMIRTREDGFEYIYVKLSGQGIKPAIAHLESVFDQFSTDYPFEYEFLDDQFADKYASEKKLSDVFSIFSMLAIFVAGLGIFGLSIFLAEQRVKEIGIRKVLGATTGHIIWVLNNGITKLIVLVALCVLPAVYYFMTDWLSDFAYHITINAQLLIVPLVGLILIVWAILMFQSYKSAKSNPVQALRTE